MRVERFVAGSGFPRRDFLFRQGAQAADDGAYLDIGDRGSGVARPKESGFRAGVFCSGKEGEPLAQGVYLDIHDQDNGEPDAAGTKKTKRKRACSSGG